MIDPALSLGGLMYSEAMVGVAGPNTPMSEVALIMSGIGVVGGTITKLDNVHLIVVLVAALIFVVSGTGIVSTVVST